MSATPLPRVDPRVLLSSLWTFAVFNYLYADVLGLMDPQLLKQYLSGTVGGLTLTPGFLFGSAVLMETAIVMVPVSRLLGHVGNRRANLAAAAIHTLAVSASLLVGKPTAYYLFFAVIEVACTATIFVYAWRWKAEPLS